MEQNNLNLLDRLMVSPGATLKGLAGQGYKKAKSIASAPSEALGNKFAGAFTDEQLVEMVGAAEARVRGTRDSTAGAFGEQGKDEVSNLALLLGGAGEFASRGGGLPGTNRINEALASLPVGGAELGRQVSQSVKEGDQFGEVGNAALGGAADYLLPQSEGDFLAATLLGTTGVKGAKKLGKTVEGAYDTRKIAKANKAARSADVTGLPVQGPKPRPTFTEKSLNNAKGNVSAQKAQLSKAGIDVKELEPEVIAKLHKRLRKANVVKGPNLRAEAQADEVMRNLEGKPVTRTGTASKVTSKGDSTVSASTPSPTSAPVKKSLLRRAAPYATGAGVAYGINEGLDFYNANTQAAGMSKEELDSLNPLSGQVSPPPMGGAPTPMPTPTTTPMPTPSPPAVSASPQEGELMQALRFLQSQKQEPNTLRKIGDMLMNTGQALEGRDPRITQQQLNQSRKSPAENLNEGIIPALIQARLMNQVVSPVDQARIDSLSSESALSKRLIESINLEQ